MADYGEWTRKGATLSDVTALKEFGVSRDFIVKGIRAGKLEYREGSIWGNPYIRVLRRQLEEYIAEQVGTNDVAEILMSKGLEGCFRWQKKVFSCSKALILVAATAWNAISGAQNATPTWSAPNGKTCWHRKIR